MAFVGATLDVSHVTQRPLDCEGFPLRGKVKWKVPLEPLVLLNITVLFTSLDGTSDIQTPTPRRVASVITFLV